MFRSGSARVSRSGLHAPSRTPRTRRSPPGCRPGTGVLADTPTLASMPPAGSLEDSAPPAREATVPPTPTKKSRLLPGSAPRRSPRPRQRRLPVFRNHARQRERPPPLPPHAPADAVAATTVAPLVAPPRRLLTCLGPVAVAPSPAHAAVPKRPDVHISAPTKPSAAAIKPTTPVVASASQPARVRSPPQLPPAPIPPATASATPKPPAAPVSSTKTTR